MIRAVLIDDELNSLHALEKLLQAYCTDVSILARCASAEQGIQALQNLKPDLVFLDIEMPRMNGFDLLQLFPEACFKIIFTTSYDQYAIKAIHCSALDYLLKPIEAGELVAAVAKLKLQKNGPFQEQFEMLKRQLQGNNQGFCKIALPTLDGYELINADEVIYCQADDNYTHFHLKNQPRLTCCRSLKETEIQLEAFTFFLRVHHSFIVNLNEVKKYVRGDGGYLVMSNDCTVNVSRSRKEKLLQRF